MVSPKHARSVTVALFTTEARAKAHAEKYAPGLLRWRRYRVDVDEELWDGLVERGPVQPNAQKKTGPQGQEVDVFSGISQPSIVGRPAQPAKLQRTESGVHELLFGRVSTRRLFRFLLVAAFSGSLFSSNLT